MHNRLQIGQNFTTVKYENCLLQELATCQTKECVHASAGHAHVYPAGGHSAHHPAGGQHKGGQPKTKKQTYV